MQHSPGDAGAGVCRTCHGKGTVAVRVKGKKVERRPCPACAGSKKAGVRTK